MSIERNENFLEQFDEVNKIWNDTKFILKYKKKPKIVMEINLIKIFNYIFVKQKYFSYLIWKTLLHNISFKREIGINFF